MWLIYQQEAAKLSAILSTVTPEAIEKANANFDALAKQPVKVEGDTAQIPIKGVLTKNREAIYDYFGIEHTAYTDIESQISEAREKGATKIDFAVNSGGGTVEGMYSAMDAIRNSGMQTTAKVSGMAASAAYMLSSQTDTIIAENKMSLIGSNGVVTTVFSHPFFKDVTNTASPDKRPDAKTDEGIAAVQAELDDIYNVIVEKVAEGRRTTVDAVNETYGKGAVMTARTALKNKMIDAIDNKQPAKQTKQAAITGVKTMDMKEFKAEHGDLYSAAIEAGVKQERGRVASHLKLADASGDMDLAIAAINSGEEVTGSTIADHGAAQIKKQNIQAREEEAPAPVAGDKPAGENDDFAAMIKELAAIDGVEVEMD